MRRFRLPFVIAVLLAALFLLRERIWSLLADPYVERPVDFVGIMPPRWPNRYLVCPEDLCRHGRPDALAPVYAMPARLLRQSILAFADREPDLQIIQQAQDGYYMRFLQRTAFMRFPDIVAVLIVPIDAEHATLAICSYSLLGYGDMGANQARVERWLAALSAR
jgi:uncharacterized protein (DUF1499 family)